MFLLVLIILIFVFWLNEQIMFVLCGGMLIYINIIHLLILIILKSKYFWQILILVFYILNMLEILIIQILHIYKSWVLFRSWVLFILKLIHVHLFLINGQDFIDRFPLIFIFRRNKIFSLILFCLGNNLSALNIRGLLYMIWMYNAYFIFNLIVSESVD